MAERQEPILTMEKLAETILRDTKDMKLMGREPDEQEAYEYCVQLSWRNLGQWIHDEERGHEQEKEGDMDWREDDDNMILAPGEFKKISDELIAWVNRRSWWNKVKVRVDAGEKCRLSVYITTLP